MNLTIGSGDIPNLLMGKKTKGYASLWQKFLDDYSPYYNAFASPIDALRTGAILEGTYLRYLPDGYFFQVKKEHNNFDCLRVSLDFTRIDKGEIVDFDELKTIWFTDFVDTIKSIEKSNDHQSLIKKSFKNNYNQVQSQLMATNLESANIVFLCVYSYDDTENNMRVVQDRDVVKFRITRDNEVIDRIESELEPFQKVKNIFK